MSRVEAFEFEFARRLAESHLETLLRLLDFTAKLATPLDLERIQKRLQARMSRWAWCRDGAHRDSRPNTKCSEPGARPDLDLRTRQRRGVRRRRVETDKRALRTMARWFEELAEASAPEPARAHGTPPPCPPAGPADNGQVQLTEVVKGLGGDYVDALPLPPGKMIRLQQLTTTGRNYQPRAIELPVSLADGATNLTDLEIRFSLHGKSYGRSIRASEFIIDGTPHRVPFPPCRGETLTVGSLERLAVDVHHRGQGHSVNSIRAAVYYVDNNEVPVLRSWQSQPDSDAAESVRVHPRNPSLDRWGAEVSSEIVRTIREHVAARSRATPEPPSAPQEDMAAKFRALEERHARLRARFNELAAIVSELTGAG